MANLGTNFQIAFRSLIQHRRRALFLGGAIGSVTALLVLLNGLSTGVRETMEHTATTLSSGHVNVGGFFKVSAGQSAPVVTDYAKVLEIVKRSVPELAFTVQRGRGWAKLVSDSGSMQAGIGGIDIKDEPAFKSVLHIVSGNIDDLAQPGTILLFEDQLKKLDVKIGDAITVSAQTTRGVANTIDCRVVAIARDVGLMSKWNVFVPMVTLRALYQLSPGTTGAIHLHLKPRDQPHALAIAARLRGTLEQAGYRMMDPDPRAFWMKFDTVNREQWTGQKLDVTTWEDELSFLTWTLQLLVALKTLLLLILVAIVVTGIMNTMWIAIRERTREIGTLRAIGMQRGGILWMFLMESLLLGLGSAIGGAIIGSLIAVVLNGLHIAVPITMQFFLMSDHLQLAIHGGEVVTAVILLTVLTGLAALYPSFRAARLRPVEAMSHFG
ncbi:MAG TPA: FtsX-like permease family protein [Polyangia bacterium]|jgi:ABC-type lipoprotein release transport system permease subunit